MLQCTEFLGIFEHASACSFWQHGEDWDEKRVSCGERFYEATHFFRFILFQAVQVGRQNGGCAVGDAQMYVLAAEEMVGNGAGSRVSCVI